MARPGAPIIAGTLARASGSFAKCWIVAGTAGPIATMAMIGRNAAITIVTPCGRSVRSPKKAASLFIVSPSSGDTAQLEWGFGTYHGRGVTVGGSAILLTARKLAEQLVALAARRTNLGIEELEFKDGAIRRKDAGLDAPPVMTLEALAAQADDPAALQATEKFSPANRTYTSGAHVAKVEVDVETGKVEVLRYLIVEDVGRCINPALVHGQAIGGAVMGIGATFFDELIYDSEGQLLTGSFADYLMATSTEFPEIEAITLETSLSKLNPLGAKGAGEGGIVGAGGALANAVAHALAPLGVNVTSLPLNPNNVLRMIREAAPSQAAE